jgi:hypothetical protein
MGKHDAEAITLQDLVAEGEIRVEGGARVVKERVSDSDRPYRFKTDKGAIGYFKSAELAFGHARKNILVTKNVTGGEVTELLTGRYWRLERISG